MPCRDWDAANNETIRDNPEHIRKIDVLTRRLCQACGLLEGYNVEMPEELGRWWEEHKAADELEARRRRLRAEAAEKDKKRTEYLESVRLRLMGQLTVDELEALGLSRRGG